MIRGVIVGLVKDNVDPDGMHRVLVEYPVVHSDKPESSWCRMMTPMAGKDRGLVILPDKGTEVVLAFAYRSMNPFIVGAVYNGEADKPEPYKNDDKNDDKRVFWSRNDHMVIFDDTDKEEKVELGAQAATRLQVSSAPIYQTLDSSKKKITEYCDGDTSWEAIDSISVKCTDFKLEASKNIEIKANISASFKSDLKTEIRSATNQDYKAAMIAVNPNSPPPDPGKALSLVEAKHPPTKPDE